MRTVLVDTFVGVSKVSIRTVPIDTNQNRPH